MVLFGKQKLSSVPTAVVPQEYRSERSGTFLLAPTGYVDPFATPLVREVSHPADDARMRAMLGMLRLLPKLDSEADSIEHAWREFIDTMAYHPAAEYHLCYSDAQFDAITHAVKEGVEGIGVVTAASRTKARVRDSLNEAWRTFWKSPAAYPTWEVDEVGKLLAPTAA